MRVNTLKKSKSLERTVPRHEVSHGAMESGKWAIDHRLSPTARGPQAPILILVQPMTIKPF